jgi:hypothetical protein
MDRNNSYQDFDRKAKGQSTQHGLRGLHLLPLLR